MDEFGEFMESRLGDQQTEDFDSFVDSWSQQASPEASPATRIGDLLEVPLDVLGAGAASGAGEIIGGLSGLGALSAGGTPEQAGQNIEYWKDKLNITPDSLKSREAMQWMGETAKPIYEGAVNYGQKGLEALGLSPEAAKGISSVAVQAGLELAPIPFAKPALRAAGAGLKATAKAGGRVIPSGIKEHLLRGNDGLKLRDLVQSPVTMLERQNMPEMAWELQSVSNKAFTNDAKWHNDFLNELLDNTGKLRREAPEVQARLQELYLENKMPEFNKLYESYFGRTHNYRRGQMMGEFWKRFKKVHPKATKIEKYMPRKVKDPKGLALAIEANPKYGKPAVDKMVQLERDLSSGKINEQAYNDGVSKLLVSGGKSSVQAKTSAHMKKRTMNAIPDEFKKYYEDWDVALQNYSKDMSMSLAEMEFLGKGDFKSGIENVLDRVSSTNKYSPDQLSNLRHALEARFSPQARAQMNPGLRATKQLSYLGTIADPASAVTQFSDVFANIGDYGLMNTLKSIRQRKLSTKTVGVHDAQHEIAESKGGISNVLDKAMEWSGFKKADFFGKNSRLNASYLWLTNKARKDPVGLEKYYLKQGAPSQVAKQWVEALNKGDPRNLDVISATLNELMRNQPLTLEHMPIQYLKSPNGRLFYTLKTWSIHQLNRMLRESKRGEYGSLLRYMGALAGGTAAIDITKEFAASMASGKNMEVEDVSDEAISALWKTLIPVVSRYNAESLLEQGPVTFVGQQATPPAWVAAWETIMTLFGEKDPTKIVGYVPGGRLVKPFMEGE